MTKKAFLKKLAELYRVANMSDSDNKAREKWTNPKMAYCVASPLDQIIRNMRECEAITDSDVEDFYNSLS